MSTQKEQIERINAIANSNSDYDWELQDMGDYIRLRDTLTQSTIASVAPSQLDSIYTRVKTGEDLLTVVTEVIQ